MRAVGFLVFATACFAPVPPEGAACTARDECPAPLICDLGTCRVTPLPLPDAPACEPPSRDVFGPPRKLEISAALAFEGTPALTGDGLELFYKRSGETVDIWRASRTDPAMPFAMPALVSALSSTGYDASPELAADGLTIWLSSVRVGALGSSDFWVATRATRTAAWSTPAHVPELSSPAAEEGLHVLPSGLVAYFHSARGGDALPHLYRSTRTSLAARWSEPVLVQELAGLQVNNPWVSADECRLYFNTPTPDSTQSLVVAARADPASPFAAPVAVPGLESAGFTGDPWLTPDERTLVFASDRDDGSYDLYRATR